MFVTLESLAKRTRRYVRVLKNVVVESKLERGVHFRLMYLVRLCSVQKSIIHCTGIAKCSRQFTSKDECLVKAKIFLLIDKEGRAPLVSRLVRGESERSKTISLFYS